MIVATKIYEGVEFHSVIYSGVSLLQAYDRKFWQKYSSIDELNVDKRLGLA